MFSSAKQIFKSWSPQYDQLSQEEKLLHSPDPGPNSEGWSRYKARALKLHASFLAIYALLAVAVITYLRRPSFCTPSLIHSPALEVLQHERHEYSSEAKSYYIQPPSPEIDQRWKDLLLGNFVRLSREDLRKINREEDAVILEDDGSGVGLMNVHHEIHCVPPGILLAQRNSRAAEIESPSCCADSYSTDHCLDYLLQAAMCHGDVGFMTYHWDMKRPQPVWKAAEHTCVKWDVLRDWMRARKAPIHEPGFIKHPIYGPAYPDGVPNVPTINDLLPMDSNSGP
ncbi:hypothetical protein T310_2558 [Rasamsonia emersonii CBS 393.64]|uniref:Tat pathway signal sequence n=1 Tax=Rasamsonia emersonii (strain ATCC 16479 / CBS 393.64 / IMI 116815) TaxID=1408163 RepID=A0A0F4YZ65_RASE3|nr:hypothetical protein T310_2558 [Rasamsonia emersonii CBS 393.64]KKA23385.1 hypothetical protein T310_2558 [Rasamsonia emersonii CBS 393.64]